jgi:hypothetical protein
MLLATHGRALWILDHLEPIQEYTAATAAASDAKLFTIPTALEWKTKDDQNDEFWGHQFFVGENPPNEAVIPIYLKRPATNLKLRISDALGRQVRELTVPAGANQAGIQTVCWDMHLDPISGAGAPAGGRGGGGAGGAGRGGAGNQGFVPQPGVGYLPANPCGGGGGGGGGFGGGGGGAAPSVAPGTYTVALVADGKTIESKPLKVVLDPAVASTDQMATRYFAVAADLHSMQRRAMAISTALNTMYPQMADIASKIDARSDIPATVKTQFAALNRDFNAVRRKFGVPPQPTNVGGGRGGRGGGGPPADTADVVNRTATLKNQIQGIWEIPSETLARQYADAKLSVPKAIAEGNAFLTKAAPLSAALKKYDLTLTVPPVEK